MKAKVLLTTSEAPAAMPVVAVCLRRDGQGIHLAYPGRNPFERRQALSLLRGSNWNSHD